MALNIKAPANNAAAQAPRSSEWAHRSLAASGQQKLFQTVLNQERPSAESGNTQETNSLPGEMNSLRDSQIRSQNLDNLRSGGRNHTMDGASSNTLATTALISLTALMPSRGDSLTGLVEAIGGGAMARSRLRGAVTEPAKQAAAPPTVTRPAHRSKGLGELSARFESGEAGVDAIGYDDTGGTSYGLYQISSRTGTMRRFISYLEDNAPEWAKRLKEAGPLDSGGRRGAAPREWQRIAAEDPNRFARLQHDFIHETHYAPALEEINERTGVDIEKHSRALQEVLWSTAVQHGAKGAANIFCKAIESGIDGKRGDTRTDNASGKELIDSVYASRSRKFGSSSSSVRSSVLRRFEEEKMLAQTMLSQEGRNITARA